MLASINRHYLRRPLNFKQKYGREDSWVLVTGGSDGVGLEVCQQMARQGFNICMVARNEAKMAEKLAHITESFPQVKVKSVVFDFADHWQVQDYQNDIADQVKDIDIAMVFLNAGVGQVGAFNEISPQDVERICRVNALQPLYLTKVLLPLLIGRNHPSAIVYTSSGLGI